MTGSTRIRILLVDDHALFRKGLVNLFQEEPDFEVVGEAADGIEALAQAVALGPDVILMDVHMPRANGPEATRRIREAMPEAKVVLLTVSGGEEDVIHAVQSGAQGYLLKTIDPPALFDALRGVVRGEAALASGVATTLLRAFARQGPRPAAPAPPGAAFSLRAQQIIALVADGKRNKEIATVLCLAENTVKNHLKNILATLHLDNRVQVAAFALRTQCVPPAQGAALQASVTTAAPSTLCG